MYEKIKNLCKRSNVSINTLEKELGFSKGSLCKIDKNKPSMDKLQKIANFFGIQVTELLDVTLTTPDKNDIAKDLENIMFKIRNGEYDSVAFGGEIPEDDMELFAGQIELMLKKLKVLNKEKYSKK